MKQLKAAVVLIVGIFLVAMHVAAQDAGKSGRSIKLNKIYGPTNAIMKDVAAIKVPAGYVFLDADNAKKLMMLEGDRANGNEVGYLSPTNAEWAVWFMFSDIGYVKDDDKDKLDADKLLKAIKAGNDAQNEYRKQQGAPAITLIGWEFQPKYNADTHNLEWAIRGECEGRPILNYNTRLLGRRGAMEVVLVVDPNQLTATLPEYQAVLGGYSYQSGQSYAEYRQGDKVAKYGLAALITGGAAVVAVKTGLFAALMVFLKKGWKVVVLGVAAVGAWLKRLFTGDRSRSSN